MPAADRLSVNRLGALLSTLRRWREFALRLGFDLAQPTALQLNTFLKEVARGGPYSWLGRLSRPQLVPGPIWGAVPSGSLAGPRVQAPSSRAHLTAKVGIAAMGVREHAFETSSKLRYHLPGAGLHAVGCGVVHSVLSTCNAPSLTGARAMRCSSPAPRARHGARVPGLLSSGRCQTSLSLGSGLVKIVQDFVTLELLPERNYLWPALQLDPLDLWQVTEHTPWRLDRKLSRGRFLELLRGALLDIGTAPDQAQTAGFNRLRRFLPTLGNVVRPVPSGPAGSGQLG